jgi:NADH-quinone oxidoreductase subunit C
MNSALQSVISHFPQLQTEPGCDIPTLIISPEHLISTLTKLYHDPDLQFQFLTDLCGVHYPDAEPEVLGVVYHLHALQKNCRIRLKCFVPITHPQIPSVTSLFASANWMERETYDFFGIEFTGHPNLTRILNLDEMTEFPMRKDITLEDPSRTDKEDAYFGR